MLNSYKRGQTSVIIRVKIRNTSVSTGAGLTGLTFSSTGLVISTIAENEATATTYTAAGSTIETITTLGTYSAPTATKCRFKEVDATNHPGIYEIQLADSRFAVSNSKYLLISIFGATNAAECDAIIELTDFNKYDSVRGGLTALPNANAEASGGLYTRGTGAGQINQTANGTVEVNVATFAANTGLQTVRSNTAQAGASGSITLDASASSTTDFYKGLVVRLTGGTGSGQKRIISAYNGTTKVATVIPNWATNPDNTSTFALLDNALAYVQAVDSSVVATASLDPTTISSIATAVWQDTTSGDFTVSGSIGKSLFTSGNVPGAAGGLFIAGTNAATTITTALTTTFTGNLTGSIGSVANNGISRASFDVDTGLQTTRSNTAQAGGATSITLDASASATNDYYKNQLCFITGGTGVGQCRVITAYVGSTKVATVSTWATNPDNTSTFAIIPFDALSTSAPTVSQIATAVWQDTTIGDFNVANSIGKSLYTNGNSPGSSSGLLIAGTNSGATSFTGGVTISSSTDYALQVTCTANSKAAVRLRGNAAATHGIIVEAIGSGDSRAATFLSSTGATTIGITGPDLGAGILLEAGVNGTAITLNGGDNIVDKPVILIDNPYVTGTGIQISGTGGPSTGIKIDTNGTAVNLVGTNTSAIVITASGTTNYCAEVTSTTSQGSIIITSTQGVGLNVKGATDGGIFQSTATGNGLTLTRGNSSYNDLNLTNNDSGTWPTVQGYASGQAPLQPTVAGRTLNVSATGLADADLKALNGNTTAAINQANAAIAVYSGTVTSSPTTTTLRDTGLTQVDSNFWNGRVIIFTSGGLKYQGAKITAFDPSTDQLTFDAMTSAPSVSNTYIIV